MLRPMRAGSDSSSPLGHVSFARDGGFDRVSLAAALRSNLKQYSIGSGTFLVVWLASASFLVMRGAAVVLADKRGLLVWAVFTVIAVGISARHSLALKGTQTGASITEALIFLALIVIGPYPTALLAAIEAIVACRRLRVKPLTSIFNASNYVLSVFLAAKAYFLAKASLAGFQAAGTAPAILRFGAPVLALAFVYYVIQMGALAVIIRLTTGIAIRKTLADRFPWEPASFLAASLTAGIVSSVAGRYGLLTAGVAVLLALPVPVLIYYVFKTYREKLDEQDRHFREMSDISDSILEMLAMAIDAKDQTTHDHIQRVKLFARRMAELVGLSTAEIEAVKAGALLHDIGKIGVPSYILNKPGKLTEHEFEQMKMHTIIGADMLSNVNFRYPVVPIVRHHHERWDGHGYPDGLMGDQIPVTARILTLVDNYDALRSDRPYHKAMTREEALDYIQDNAGVFFDPRLVEIFLSKIDEFELEAAAIKTPVRKRSEPATAAMRAARPAAGLETSQEADRAAAALDTIAETNLRVSAMFELARNLAGAFSLDDTTALLTNRLSKVIPFTTCAVALFDSSRSEFDVVHAIGREADKFAGRTVPVSAGITGWVIQNRRPMYNTNPVLDLGFLGPELSGEYKAVMVFPLLKGDEPLGAIGLYSTEFAAYSAEYIQTMESISRSLSISIHNALAFERAERAALTDAPTGLANMRALSAAFTRERTRLGADAQMSIVMVNAENLSEAWSGAGATEDDLMRLLGERIKQKLRDRDVIARHSSSSFVVLLADNGPGGALEVLARLHEEIAAIPGFARIRSSIGAATSPTDGRDLEELIRSARTRSLPVQAVPGAAHCYEPFPEQGKDALA